MSKLSLIELYLYLMSQSPSYARTRKSLRNSIVALSLQIVSLLVGFFSRKIFLDYLGTEILGLNTTASSLLGFLNLAELGIGTAISVTLYKPLFDRDQTAIREIVALQGWLYKRIALFIIAGSAVLMCFFPRIFSKTDLPIWYAYVSYIVLLFGSMLGYFVNYKQNILAADQNDYKIQYSYKSVLILKLVAQALAVRYLPHPYLWWAGLEVTFAIIASLSLNRTIVKSYPFIKEKVDNPGSFRKKYPIVVTKVKQMFFHKISWAVLNQTSPIIIYAFASLTTVAMYGNYLIITNNLSMLLLAVFSSMTPSVGNMVAEGDKGLIMRVFRELFSSRFWIVGVCCICIWFLADPFITVWIGPGYLLDRSTLLLIVILFYISSSFATLENYLLAHGLVHDIWSSVAEAVLNLGCSILLGSFYGLNGILTGIIISQVLNKLIWKPYFLFHSGLHEPVRIYIGIYLKHLAAFAVCFFLISLLLNYIHIDPAHSIGSFLLYGLILFLTCSIILGAVIYVTESGLRGFFKRIFHVTSEFVHK